MLNRRIPESCASKYTIDAFPLFLYPVGGLFESMDVFVDYFIHFP
jgi:hypothetical protein